MKLVRFGNPGSEKPGLVDDQGRLRDLSDVVADITPANLSRSTLQKIAAITPSELPLVTGEPRLGVPVTGVGKFIAIGLNYADHAAEANLPLPSEPIVFMKAITSLSGPNDVVVLPKGSTKSDWEVELGIVIGTRASYVERADALAYVAGYCVVNDVSEREYQMERGGTWDKGKGCDSFGPVGPWLVTTDEVSDPQALDLWLDVNGQRMQQGNTQTMIFDCAEIVSYVSRFMTLMPGDIIATGTPPGVGMGKKPAAIYLKPGDVMTLGIEGLGTQRQQTREWSPAPESRT
ncbi:fumarylacetoacetate hydrolase family protein [Bradyrhizobium canariense]|uniref:fumarylacetoacetate hydrolase family protein n=1 Tax=Bradyrhizobium canariense TaxID=255045 RepID=UPI000A197A90|nr:fumarylacetoacetate hydrolase family protein [Bradyrhizobium canariense]OSI24902.1 2-hydroxyhepta-2,4-diene-1,7-dioate isomerase [Bradyrhizobium canariense]OSI37472.1 2-hydroxyhepta-2,4-diene-1,7-dioate isomerase [Bradyrhizobium canariense]OSI48540.1 2-hydroxyhepta-2,4-diene-1,7-dioate isomerase [Bradyrhizobium canariense]OSI53339.1 2-hydroxyhepta-2,4-diene-1,7-dioate isomerase [Bradyrhizobium canariense]OSI53586.1 2-hydroxyhepta-2,4-diene-1,7-dioate isomerase [Bradyrhizobium canariense]